MLIVPHFISLLISLLRTLLKPFMTNWPPTLSSLRSSFFLSTGSKRKQFPAPGSPSLWPYQQRCQSQSANPQPQDRLSLTHIWKLIRGFCLWNLQGLYSPILALAVSVGTFIRRVSGGMCLLGPWELGKLAEFITQQLLRKEIKSF